MASSTNVSAAVESSSTVLAYALQPDGLVFPTSGWKALRTTRNTLAIQQQTTRGSEITGKRQVSPSVIQQVTAGGEIGFNLSYGTFDDLIAAAFGSDWVTVNISGAAADISTVAAGNKLTSTTSGKFAAIVVGQMIRLSGFTANLGANNGWARVAAKTSDQDITLSGKIVTSETPTGTLAKVRGDRLRNGDDTQLVAFQQQLSAAQFFRYPAGMVGGFTLSGAVGQFFTGSLNAMTRDELFATATAGAVAAAPGGGFFNTVAAFGGVSVNDTVVDAVVSSFSVNLAREGAKMTYGMGSEKAQGNVFGQVVPTGSLEIMWRNETLYNLSRAGTLTTVSATMVDDAGQGYALSLPASCLRNGSAIVNGPNAEVTATYSIEGAQNLASHAIELVRAPS